MRRHRTEVSNGSRAPTPLADFDRRAFLRAGSLALFPGCTVSALTFSPWHLWGGQAQLSLANGAVPVSNLTVASTTLARVSYKRPESWSFLFGARLTGGTTPAGTSMTCMALFDIMAGVGRTVLPTEQIIAGPPEQFDAFVRLRWTVAVGSIPGRQPNNFKYTTSTPSQPLDDTVATSTQVIDRIVAQDLTVSVRFILVDAVANREVSAEFFALMSPLVHVRPDWLKLTPSFTGLETGGT